MGQRYEVVFSAFLPDDTPTEVLDELRWHLGLSSDRPAECALDSGHPLLQPGPPDRLPGEDVAKLHRQLRYVHREVEHYHWGLHVRLCWTDDDWANNWLPIAAWLARHAEGDGYAGFFRGEADEEPTLLLFRNGKAYLREFGGQPLPLT